MGRATEERIESLLSEMSLREKVALCSGADMWHTRAIERLGIPALRVTDGPHGTRTIIGDQYAGWVGLPAICFPTASAMAATWNTELIQRVGAALADETKDKGSHILLGPAVNIHRSPLGGRNFECFSEDPYLTAQMAVAYIRGLQGQGIGASIKHYAGNNSEFQRMTLNSNIGERALREIYLPAFQAAVQQANPWTVMCSYNAINGTPASANRRLLTEILKEEWGYRGLVVSDWHAVYDRVAAANAGLDLEMPGKGPTAVDALEQAVRNGQVSESVIDDKVRRLLRTVAAAGAFAPSKTHPPTATDASERRLLARQVAAEAMVLLKNDAGLLPLQEDKLGSIAIIGPAAAAPTIQGAGSSRVTAETVVTPLEGLRNRCGDRIRIEYEPGCSIDGSYPELDAESVFLPEGDESGFRAEYFSGPGLSGEPLVRRVERKIGLTAESLPPELAKADFSVRWTGRFVPPVSGECRFDLKAAGLGRILIDGRPVGNGWSEPLPTPRLFVTSSLAGSVHLSGGASHVLAIEYKRDDEALCALRVGCSVPAAESPIDKAVALASRCDAAIVVVGLPDRYETEFLDRPHIELTGDQADLIERVAAANPKTAVVLCNGAPVSMDPWIDKVSAVVEAWYAGQECGNALAQVLFGDVNPSGRLPTTFPQRIEDSPACTNYPGENDVVLYGEGIFVGYRYYDQKKVEPLFAFGHGLSYTTFTYANLRVDPGEMGIDDELQVTIDVTNTGPRRGQEVVQLYVRDVVSSLIRPPKELKAFRKVDLECGQTKTVTLTLTARDLAFYDPARKGWVAEAGVFSVLVGASSADIRAEGTFSLVIPGGGAVRVDPEPRITYPRWNADTPLSAIMSDRQGKAILRKHLGPLVHNPRLRLLSGYSLNQLSRVSEEMPKELLEAIVEDLGRADED